MLMIVSAHANQWGFTFRESVHFSSDNLFNSLLFPLVGVFNGNFGVNLFVLISSWFLSQSTSMKYRKIVNIWLQILFYSFGIALLFALYGRISFSETIPYLTPIYHNQYWFMTKYVGFMLIVPFLPLFYGALDRERFHAFFVAMALLCTTIVIGLPYGNIFINESSPSSMLLWILLFGFAYYFRKFGEPMFIKQHKGLMLMGVVLLQWVGGIAINVFERLPCIAGCFSSASNGLTLITSILFFLWFKDIRFSNSVIVRLLTYIAPFSFGVYMLHEHPLVRRIVWGDLFNMSSAFNSMWYIPYLASVCILIFTVGAVVDWLRTMLFSLFKKKEFA